MIERAAGGERLAQKSVAEGEQRSKQFLEDLPNTSTVLPTF